MQRLRDALILVSILALTCVAWPGFASLPVDVENASMKAVGTPDAAVAVRAEEEFGVDHPVILLLEPRIAEARGPGFAEDAKAWYDALRIRPEVATARLLPARGEGVLLAAVGVREDGHSRYAGAVRDLLEDARRLAPPTHRVQASGLPVGEIAIAEALVDEQSRIVPAIAATLFLLLLGWYRRLFLATAALLPGFLGIVLLGGLQSVLGEVIDPVSSMLAPVLLTVGVAGSVHLVEKFLEHRERGDDVERSSRSAVSDLVVPATLTVTTTFAGFLGLCASPVPAVRRFGMFAALGVGITCLMAFLTVPSWLRLFARSTPTTWSSARQAPWSVFGAGVASWLRRRARSIVALAGVVTILSVLGWTFIRVDTDPTLILPDDHPFRTATDRIAERIGGVDTFDLLLEPPAPAFAAAQVAMLLGRIALVNGIAGPGGAPRRGANGSYLVPVLLRPGGSAEREATFAAVEASAHELGWPNAHATGSAVRIARDSGALVRGQWAGLLFTLAFVWTAMTLGFRSLRLGTLGLVPNILPCVILYGALGISGHPLSVGTAMIGSVMLGVVVDDTIHFLHGYRLARSRGSGVTVSLARAFRRSGRAIVVTSLVLAAGFSVGLIGELETTREFGALASGTILAALIADLILLPALVLLRARTFARGAV